MSRKNRILITGLAFTLFSANPPVLADDTENFIALKASLSKAAMDNISHHNTIGTGQPFGNGIDGQIEDPNTDDYIAGLGVSFGRRWSYWTVEGELFWRYRTDWDIAAPTHSIATITNVFSNVATTSFIVNLLRRGPISQNWSWELGAGIGLVRNTAEAEYIERSTSTTPEMTFKDDRSEVDFSYNVLAGLVRPIGREWSMNLRYRYIDLGELKAGPFPNRNARLSADHSSHEVQISFERELW